MQLDVGSEPNLRYAYAGWQGADGCRGLKSAVATAIADRGQGAVLGPYRLY